VSYGEHAPWILVKRVENSPIDSLARGARPGIAGRAAPRSLRAAREAYSSGRLGWPQILWRSVPRRNGLRQRGFWQATWDSLLVLFRVSMQGFDGQCDALTAADVKRDRAARQIIAAHRVDRLGRQHCTGRADRTTPATGSLGPETVQQRRSWAQPRHRLGEIFAANVWVTIFPLCTMKVSVASSKRLSAVSAFHTM
jgi:hypothetical protein